METIPEQPLILRRKNDMLYAQRYIDARRDTTLSEQTKHYAFFQNTLCEYFPCHVTDDPEHFNCLFCYCPLYALGKRCGGNFRYSEKGYKDCTNCLVPHRPENYEKITGRYAEIMALVRENDAKAEKEK